MLDLLENLHAVEFGHLQVCHQHIDRLALQHIHRLASIKGGQGRMAPASVSFSGATDEFALCLVHDVRLRKSPAPGESTD
ncbi:uncharacterized protein METZ01_LOCUS247314 [marine metagenome]|uniref:Uncharacterized protein n=1 Tax=marine metagenome TaxID=408172 RepID=A0A382I483_9ZZZZ